MHKIVTTLLLIAVIQVCDADTIIEVPASPEKGFNFPYLIKLPENLPSGDHLRLIVETNNTGKVSDDISIHYAAAKDAITGNAVGPWLSKKLSLPILMPVLPRSESQWENYTHALDRDTMLEDASTIKRIDLQLLVMIEDAKNRLHKRSINVGDNIILTGFSASGTFANRFSLLHPEIIEIVIAGGLNGTLMLPLAAIGEHKLNYPLGVNDFEDVADKPFNRTAWLRIHQFLFMGEQDTNDAVAYDDAYSEAERVIIHNTTGKNMQPERWLNSQKHYIDSEADVLFRTFQGIGHGTNGKIHQEFLEFVQKNL